MTIAPPRLAIHHAKDNKSSGMRMWSGHNWLHFIKLDSNYLGHRNRHVIVAAVDVAMDQNSSSDLLSKVYW